MSEALPSSSTGLVKFINCRLVTPEGLVKRDLVFSAITGCIVSGQERFYSHGSTPDRIVDLGGRTVSPGFIDVQINGSFGFDFAVVQNDMSKYEQELTSMNQSLIKTGVTSYLPTLPSQRASVYHKTLPYLAPSGRRRIPADGAESLGAHCEGPFLNPVRKGIHSREVLLDVPRGLEDFEECYGRENIRRVSGSEKSAVTMITAAPELGQTTHAIPELASRGIIVSIGHSDASYLEAQKAVDKGATMITHLFNAMKPFHQRDPGMFGLLGQSNAAYRPYFGLIADGIHVHPAAAKVAANSYPEGLILVTDAMMLLGMPDGMYNWTNGERIRKRGTFLTLNDTEDIAGAAVPLIDGVSNFLNWSGVSIAEALKAVTSTPAKMLGMADTKGTLKSGADADMVVLDEVISPDGGIALQVHQVWKFGGLVHEARIAKL